MPYLPMDISDNIENAKLFWIYILHHELVIYNKLHFNVPISFYS